MRGMLIDNEFELGEMVYLKTDSEQTARLVTCISVFSGSLLYTLNCGTIESKHMAMEISRERNGVLVSTN